MSSPESPADPPAPDSSPAESAPPRQLGLQPADTKPAKPKKKKKGGAAGCLVVLLLVLAGVGVLIWKLPEIVEGRIYAYLEKQDWERKALTVSKVGWNQLVIEDVDLANDGWAVQNERLEVDYSILNLITTRRADLGTLTGLNIELDLVAMEEAAKEKEAAGEVPSSPPATPEKFTLKDIASSIPIDVIQLADAAQVTAKRGEAVQTFQIEGAFAMNGPMDFTVDGSGVSPVTVVLGGQMAAPVGTADLQAELSVGELSALMAHFDPAWAEAFGEGSVIDIGVTELSGRFPFRGNKAQFETLEGQVDVRAFKKGDIAVGPTQITFAQVDGGAFAVTTTSFDLSYGGEVVKSVCEMTLEVGSGTEWRASEVQGTLKIASASLFGVPVEGFEMPIEGTIADIRFSGLQLFSPEYPDVAVSEVSGDLKEVGTDDFTFASLGNMLLRIPGMTARNPAEKLDGAGQLPISAKSDEGGLQAKLNLGAEADPVTYEKEGISLESVGVATVDTKVKEGGEMSLDGTVKVDRITVFESEEAVTALTGLNITMTMANNRLDIQGEGQLDGETFPITSNYSFGEGEDEGSVKGQYAVGPVALKEVTWIGEFVEALKDVNVSATVDSSGSVDRKKDGTSSSEPFQVRIRNGRLVYPDDLLTATGVQTDIGMTFNPPALQSTFRLKADRVETSDLVMRNVSLTIEPLENNGARVVAFSADLWEGRVLVTKPFVIPADRRNFACTVLIRSINAQELVKLIPDFNGTLDAYVSGQLPFKVTNGKLTMLDGYLGLDKDRPAVLKYDATGLLTQGLKEGKRQYKIYQQAEVALGNLIVNELVANIYGPDTPSDGRVIVKLEGESAEEQRTGLITISKIPVNLNLVVDEQKSLILEKGFQRVYGGVLDVSVNNPN